MTHAVHDGQPILIAVVLDEREGLLLVEVESTVDRLGSVVGALLHDIGHFTSEFGTFTMDDTEDRHHEDAGAEVLEQFFPSVVTDCCRHHVAAKRYLCATRPEYFKRLSEASIHSLSLQGGPMSPEEVAEFEKNPNLKEIIAVRYLDEAGKIAGMETPDFWHFAPMVQGLVNRHLTNLSQRGE